MSSRRFRVPKLPRDPEPRERKYEQFVQELGLPENAKARSRSSLYNFWEKPLHFLNDNQWGNPISLNFASSVFEGILSNEDFEYMKVNGIFRFDNIPGRSSSTYLASFQAIRRYIVVNMGMELADLRNKVPNLRSRYATYLKTGQCTGSASNFSASNSTRSRAAPGRTGGDIQALDQLEDGSDYGTGEDEPLAPARGTAGGLLGIPSDDDRKLHQGSILNSDSEDEYARVRVPAAAPLSESPHSFLRRAQVKSASGSFRSNDIERSLQLDMARSTDTVRSEAHKSAEESLLEQNLRVTSDRMDIGLDGDVVRRVARWILSRSGYKFARFTEVVYFGFGEDRSSRREGLRVALETSASIIEESFLVASCICSLVEGDGSRVDTNHTEKLPAPVATVSRSGSISEALSPRPTEVVPLPDKSPPIRILTVSSALTAAFVAGLLSLSLSPEAEKNVLLERQFRQRKNLSQVYGTEELPVSRTAFYYFKNGVQYLIDHRSEYRGVNLSGDALLRLRMSNQRVDCSILETKIKVISDAKAMADTIYKVIADAYENNRSL